MNFDDQLEVSIMQMINHGDLEGLQCMPTETNLNFTVHEVLVDV
jgi:tRNA(Ile)-lysidine synthase TilS/MesJ